jgi:hypothetical protein
MNWVRAETAFEGSNNKGPLEAGGAHAGPQAPRLLQGKERREDSPCLCDSPQNCGSYLNKFTPSHCTKFTPHHHTRKEKNKRKIRKGFQCVDRSIFLSLPSLEGIFIEI